MFLNKIFNKYKKNIELILDSDLGIFLIFGILLFTTWLFYQVFYLPYFISSFVLGLSLGEYLADKIRLKIDVFKDLALSSFMFLFFFDSILNQKEISFLFNEYLVLILAIILLFLKLLTTYIGAKNFGVSKKNLFNVSFLSLIRGEFSIVAVSFIPKYFLLALVIVIFTNLLATLFFYLFYNPKTELSINK